MFPIVLKDSEKACFRAIMSLAIVVEVRVGTLGIFTMMAGLDLVLGGWKMHDLMAGRSCMALVGDCLC